MKYQPIIGSLGYILSADRQRVLMVHRITNDDDDHKGKYNGLGGKMEKGEDIHTCMVREIKEEAGIDVTDMSLRGTINWTCSGPKGEDWLGFVFLITAYTGEINEASPEGPLEWVELEKMLQLPMWEGDRYFLPLVFDHDERPFHAFMPYDYEKPLNFSYVR